VIRIGFITGIQKEAAILRENSNLLKSDITCAGANTERAYQLAGTLVENGCDVLVSFGIAGALGPTLNPGDLVFPNSVLDADGNTYKIDTTWRETVISHLKAIKINSNGPLFGSEKIISTAREKQDFNQTLGAVAVDMESLGVAKAADENTIPFIVIRAISDAAGQNLPTATFNAIDEKGNIQTAKILGKLAKNPRDIANLIKLASNSRRAFASLRRVAALGFDF
jgi:hopanoid-associated phosphorylase